MTADRIDRANAWSDRPPRMGDLRHVHGDHDPRAWHWFARGPVVAADGGQPDDDRARRRDVEDEQLRDVSHRPAHGEGANQVWDRGEEADARSEPKSPSDAETERDAV